MQEKHKIPEVSEQCASLARLVRDYYEEQAMRPGVTNIITYNGAEKAFKEKYPDIHWMEIAPPNDKGIAR